MMDRQKEMIRVLRNLGYGYKSIAKEMELKLHVVRDFCRYHGLTGNAREKVITNVKKNLNQQKQLKRKCPLCGTEIHSRRFGGSGRHRRFCSDICRIQYWNGKRRN